MLSSLPSSCQRPAASDLKKEQGKSRRGRAASSLQGRRDAASLPLCPARYPPQAAAACLFIVARRILSPMATKSRETIYGESIRAAAERPTEARKEADRLAVEAWNKRMLGFQGPAQPSPMLGDAINAGFGYLEVKCLGCDTHQTVALDILRRPKTTPVHELDATCAAASAPKSGAMPTSAAIWSRCARPRFPPMIHLRRGGRER